MSDQNIKKIESPSMKLAVKYLCSKCGLAGHKLWRQYHAFCNQIELLCAICAEEDQGKKLNMGVPFDGFNEQWERPNDSIGWLVPAVPVNGEETYWGYTSVPNKELTWWHSLPTFQDKDREIAWLRAWYMMTLFDAQYYMGKELERLGFRERS